MAERAAGEEGGGAQHFEKENGSYRSPSSFSTYSV